MAHYYFDDQTQYGRMLRRMLNQMEESDDGLRDVRQVMINMRANAGQDDADYAEVTARFKFVSDAEAHAAFNEIDSVFLKMTTDAPVGEVVTSRVNLYDKLR